MNIFTTITIIVLLLLIFLSISSLLLRLYNGKVVYWNPELIKEPKNNNLVVLYTSINESFNKPYVKLNNKILTNYSSRHGYDYKNIIHPDNKMSPYWLRVYDLKRILDSYPDNTFVAYYDCDAVPLRPEISIESFIESIDSLYNNSTKDIYISEDPNAQIVLYNGIFNTGNFFVRNTKRSREFVNDWVSRYNSGDFEWKLNNKNWECIIKDKQCSWSSLGYEQGEFSKLYMNHKDKIQYLHWTTLACTYKDNKHCFTLHLMGHSDRERERIFNEMNK